MPYSVKQKGAACAELGRRRKGVKQSKGSGRAFGNASRETLVDFCTGTIEKKRAKK